MPGFPICTTSPADGCHPSNGELLPSAREERQAEVRSGRSADGGIPRALADRHRSATGAPCIWTRPRPAALHPCAGLRRYQEIPDVSALSVPRPPCRKANRGAFMWDARRSCTSVVGTHPRRARQVSQHPTPASRHQVNHAKRIRPPFLRVQASGGQECLRRLRSAAVRDGREMAKAGHLSQRAPAGGATAPAVGQRPKRIPAAVATAAMMARTDDGCLARLPTALMGANPPSGRTGTNGRHTKEADASRCAALR